MMPLQRAHCFIIIYNTHLIKTLIYKKLVLEQPSGYETINTQAMEVKKLIIFLSLSCYTFEDTVTYFEKDIFRKESLRDTNSYS